MEDGTRYICNSASSALLKISPSGDRIEACFPGHFCRGMAIGEQLIYVGLSERRQEQLPPDRAPKACVAVIDRTTLKVRQLVTIPFREIYDIIILPSTDQ